MPTEAFIRLPGHPRQRNTERHAKARHFENIKSARGVEKERVREVAAAVIEGNWYKVNGHTRSYLWDACELPMPPTVEVKVYYTKSWQEFNRLYATFDAPTAAERPAERVFGAYGAVGISPSSVRLRNGNILDALHLAIRGETAANQPADAPELDVYEAVATFKEELMLLDSIRPNNDHFYSGIVAAALVTLAFNPESVAFWSCWREDEWEKRGRMVDPLGRMRMAFNTIKTAGTARDGKVQAKLFAQALAACSLWCTEPRELIDQHKPMPEADVKAILGALKQFKGAETVPDLFLN